MFTTGIQPMDFENGCSFCLDAAPSLVFMDFCVIEIIIINAGLFTIHTLFQGSQLS